MKTFLYHGIQFEISDGVENYAAVYWNYVKIQNQLVKEFKGIYRGYLSIDEAISNLKKDFYTILEKCVKAYIADLIDRGYYEVGKEYFIDEDDSFGLNVVKAYYDLEDKYDEIVMTKEQMKQYRDRRKNSRDRWYGFGFGIGGALKGAAMAGTANAVTGMGHSLVNAIGNAGSSVDALAKKTSLYMKTETYTDLETALRKDMIEIFNRYLKVLQKHTGVTFIPRTQSGIEEARNIIKHIRELNLNGSEFDRAISDAFNRDPYNEEIYIILLNQYGDEKYQLGEISKIFGCNSNLQKAKEEKLNRFIDGDGIQTLEEAEQVLNECNMTAQKYGILPDNELLQRLQKMYDKKMRTVQRVEYTTIEEARKARVEEIILEEIVSKIDKKNKDDISRGLKEVEEKDLKYIKKWPFIDEIQGMYSEYKVDENLEKIDKLLVEKKFQEAMGLVKQKNSGFSERERHLFIGKIDEKVNNVLEKERTDVYKYQPVPLFIEKMAMILFFAFVVPNFLFIGVGYAVITAIVYVITFMSRRRSKKLIEEVKVMGYHIRIKRQSKLWLGIRLSLIILIGLMTMSVYPQILLFAIIRCMIGIKLYMKPLKNAEENLINKTDAY